MGKTVRFLLSLFFAAAIASPTFAQEELQEKLSKQGAEVAEEYLSPIVSGFGANMNSGWFTGAPPATMMGLNAGAKVVVLGTFFADGKKDFEMTTEFILDQTMAASIVDANPDVPSQARQSLIDELTGQEVKARIYGPTVIGSSDSVITGEVEPFTVNADGSEYSFDGEKFEVDGAKGLLEDLPFLPLFAPQIDIGMVYGTQAMIRYLPSMTISEDVGEFNYFGFGVMHNPLIWTMGTVPIPFDLGVGFSVQSMDVGDIFSASSWTMGLTASRTIGVGVSVTPYIDLLYESSTVEINYTWMRPTIDGGTTEVPITFEKDGDNAFRATVGAKFNILVASLFAEYSMSDYHAFAAGLNFGF
ncbi:MAG: hypothetical protein GF419_13010 [Ignavibacteriales bacterium]|nr:hypothetical protein [Ignavibacteriales bacterium]